jgi:fructan beta-fructosidase
MSLPREVSLTRVDGNVLLRQAAIDPFDGSGSGSFQLGPQRLVPGTLELPVTGTVARIDVEFDPGTATRVGLMLRAGGAEATLLTYDVAEGMLSLDRRTSGHVDFHAAFPSIETVAVPLREGRIRLRVYLDRCSVEVFAQDGLATITDLVFPAEVDTALAIFAEGEGAKLLALDVVGC